MVWFAIVSLLLVAVAIGAAALVTVDANRRIVDTAIRQHNDSKEIAKAGIEASSRYGALVIQTASALRTNIDAAVAARVKMINAAMQPGGPGESAPQAVEEAPVMHTSGMVDDLHEIQRDLQRVSRETSDPVREAGVGVEDAPSLGTPLEI